MVSADLGECVFNTYKGVWETHPEHWVWSNNNWIVVAMIWATTLERGVADPPGVLGRRLAQQAEARRDAENPDDWYAAEVERLKDNAPA